MEYWGNGVLGYWSNGIVDTELLPAKLWRSQERKPSREGRAELSRPIPGEHREQRIGMHRVVGDRMVIGRSDQISTSPQSVCSP